MSEFKEDVFIVFGGVVGQGIQMVEEIFIYVFKKFGYYVYVNKEYMF